MKHPHFFWLPASLIIKRLVPVLTWAAAAVFATQAIAAIKDYGLKDYVSISKGLPCSENQQWKLVCTMPYNCQFQPWIEVEAPAGKVIRFNSSNPLVLYLTETETCTTIAGAQTYEAKNWVSGEGAIYTSPSGVIVKAVKYRETGYDTTFVGSFQCDESDFNILWKKAARTAYLCMRDHFYDCLETLKKMALVTGHDSDVPRINQKLESIKSTFDDRYWKGNYYMSSQVTAPDDRANAMAVNAGLADRSKWEAIYDTVLSKRAYASCFFDRWVLEALCTMGKQEYALQRMSERYKTMIPCSFTTLWEHYDRWWASQIDAFDEGSSLNHGWNPPALILSQTIAGVSPVAPGWNIYQVLPKEAFLTAIKVVVPSIKGNVTVDLRKTASEYALGLTSPPGTTAIVGIPKSSFSLLNAIKVNNITIWDGTYRGGVSELGWVGEDADYVKFQAAPGSWKFVGVGTLPVSSHKARSLPPQNDIKLDKKSWTASASVPDSTFLFSGANIPIDVSAANAIDNDHWTGWRDMTKTQYPGQWFQVDMKAKQTFDKIVLDTTWALWDSPDKYSVAVSDDGVNWGTPIATGSGQLGITTITSAEQTARYIRITQTGTNALYHWSIYEFDVYKGNWRP